MAGLIDFHVDFVPNRYGDHLQRRAALLPLVGPIHTGPGLEGDLAAKTLRVVEQWRARVHALGNAGWAVFAGDDPRAARNRTFAANCIPSFVAVEEFSRHCGRPPCPFCWARWARGIWEATDHALFEGHEARLALGPDATLGTNVSPFDLISGTFFGSFARQQVDAETGDYKDSLPSIMKYRIDARGAFFRSLADKMGLVGGLNVDTYTPHHDAWGLTSNRLLVVPHGTEPPDG